MMQENSPVYPAREDRATRGGAGSVHNLFTASHRPYVFHVQVHFFPEERTRPAGAATANAVNVPGCAGWSGAMMWIWREI
jgi:hypothetical protein